MYNVVSPAIIHQYKAQEKDKIHTGSYNARRLYAIKQNAKIYHIVGIYSTSHSDTQQHHKNRSCKTAHCNILVIEKMLIDQN